MSNTIRYYFKKEVDVLLPVLHETYKLIGKYQKNRNKRNKENVLTQLDVIGERLQFFKKLLQEKKQPYFDAVKNQGLSVSDRIIALDIAVGSMHIEFSVPRAYMHQESDQLRKVLEKSRYVDSDKVTYSGHSDEILVKGIAASPGFVTGKAAIILKNSDYKRLPARSIVVAKMTRADVILGIDLYKISGIVTDLGGSLCHAAIIAREMQIPCVVGTQNATYIIKNRSLISVDGNDGTVRKVK